MTYLPGALFALSSIYGVLNARRRAAAALEHRSRKFDVAKVARKNILDLEPYRCARDDYSEVTCVLDRYVDFYLFSVIFRVYFWMLTKIRSDQL